MQGVVDRFSQLSGLLLVFRHRRTFPFSDINFRANAHSGLLLTVQILSLRDHVDICEIFQDMNGREDQLKRNTFWAIILHAGIFMRHCHSKEIEFQSIHVADRLLVISRS